MPEIPSLSYAMGLPPKDAIRYFESKGYAITFNWHDLWEKAHAQAFTVTGVARLDVLQDIRNGLATALREGKTERWFMQQMEPVLRRKGWCGKRKESGPDGAPRTVRMGSPARLRLIFRQNMQSAFMAGRYKQQLENAEARPFWQYVAVLDAKTRPSHKVLHGRVFRSDDAFWSTHYPPNGWGCRCRVRTLSQHRLEREGLTVEHGAGRMVTQQRELLDHRTGEVTRRGVTGYRVPAATGGETAWTDPGFSYNPGAAGLAHMLGEAARKLHGADPALAAAVVRRLTGGEAFAAWAAAPQGHFPMAVLAADDAARIGGTSSLARLSPETWAKQRRHHPELTLADYARVQDVVEQGEVVQDGALRLVYVLDEPGGYVSVVKATRKGDELYLVSFWRLSRDDAQRARIVGQLRKTEAKQPGAGH